MERRLSHMFGKMVFNRQTNFLHCTTSLLWQDTRNVFFLFFENKYCREFAMQHEIRILHFILEVVGFKFRPNNCIAYANSNTSSQNFIKILKKTQFSKNTKRYFQHVVYILKETKGWAGTNFELF